MHPIYIPLFLTWLWQPVPLDIEMHLSFFDLLMSFFCIKEKSSLRRSRSKFGTGAERNKRKATGANCSAWRRRLCAKNVRFSSARWRWFFCLILILLGFLIVLSIYYLFCYISIFYGEKMRHHGLGFLTSLCRFHFFA